MGSGAFDFVHVHEPWHYSGFVTFRAARKRGVPYILNHHGEIEESKGI